MLKKTVIVASAIFQTACITMSAADTDTLPPKRDMICGDNLSCRSLTQGEIRMARIIFNDAIDYSSTRIYKAPFFLMKLKNAAASAPDGNIYIHEENLWSDDYTKSTVGKRKGFIHEMTHVWQYQKGVNLIAASMALTLKNPFNYKSNYEYKIDGRPFKAYSTEQQAKITEHFFQESELVTTLSGGKGRTIQAARILACQNLESLHNVLKEDLPTKTPKTCKAFTR